MAASSSFVYLSALAILAQIFDRHGKAFDAVVREPDVARAGAKPDPNTALGSARLAQLVVDECDGLGLALHVDRDTGLLAAVVNAVVVEAVAMSSERFAPFRTEQHADLAAAED